MLTAVEEERIKALPVSLSTQLQVRHVIPQTGCRINPDNFSMYKKLWSRITITIALPPALLSKGLNPRTSSIKGGLIVLGCCSND
jgi:hypothetical protein